MENITNQVAESAKDHIRKKHAIDLLIESAPLNCCRIDVEITADGETISYWAPGEHALRRFSYKSVHGEWIK